MNAEYLQGGSDESAGVVNLEKNVLTNARDVEKVGTNVRKGEKLISLVAVRNRPSEQENEDLQTDQLEEGQELYSHVKVFLYKILISTFHFILSHFTRSSIGLQAWFQ